MLGEHANREEKETEEESKKLEVKGGVPEKDDCKANDLEGLAVRFNWSDKWLTGEEYYHILTHTDLYAEKLNFKKYPPKTHPQSTYTNPTSK